MRSPALHDEDHERDEAHAAADHLRGTQRRAGNEQGRGAQRLEQEADEAVPDKVQKRRLTVVLPFSLPRPYGKENKAHEIPERFIQEQRVDIVRRAAGRESHAAEDVRHLADVLAVHKVGPAPDDLPDEQSEHDAVHDRAEGDLLFSRVQPYAERGEQQSAGDGRTALPDLAPVPERLPYGVADIVRPVAENVIKPRSDDRRGKADEHNVGQRVLGNAEILRRAPHAVERGEDKAETDDRAVPVKRMAEERVCTARVERKALAEHGKRDDRAGKCFGHGKNSFRCGKIRRWDGSRRAPDAHA